MFNLENYDQMPTMVFKLKDKPGRRFEMINVKKIFGKDLEYISVEKIPAKNNTFLIRGFVRKAKRNEDK